MNLTILRRTLAEPWAIAPENLSLLTQLILHPSQTPARELSTEPLAVAPGYRPYNYESAIAASRSNLPPVPAGVHVSMIWGMLGRAWSEDEKFWLDAIDVDDLIQGLNDAPEKTLVLWFRSPGGISTGIPEAAQALRDLRASGKRVLAFTDDLMASAAYWLAAQAESVHATPTASVGSIGVYTAFYDFTRYMQNAGVSLELFKAGKLKAMGLPGNPLSGEERSYLQARVEEVYLEFTTDVLRNRNLTESTMQGQTFSGPTARAANLVDQFHPSAARFLASLQGK